MIRKNQVDLERNFVDVALSFQGCHYIWGGKGKYVFKGGVLLPHRFSEIDNITNPLYVFDCSGLVTHALWVVTKGKVDLRVTHSAKTILDTFPKTEAREDGVLLLYPQHVAIDLGRNRVVDANRGTSGTTSIQNALELNARVEVHPTTRPANTLLGVRRIPLDMSELLK